MSVNPVSMAAMAAAAEAVTATEEIAEEVPAVTVTKAPAANPDMIWHRSSFTVDTIISVCFPFWRHTLF